MDKPMDKKPLPTGNEPRKGYESLVNLGVIPEGLTVDSVALSSLARIELTEIEKLRSRALAPITTSSGLADDAISFEVETNIIPDKDVSDKLLFRAYEKNELVGYALVVIGWPDKGAWVIQHMIIDPERKGQGIGSGIVAAIEDFAIASEVESSSIYAIPIQKSGAGFWENKGYVDETQRHYLTVAGLDHELVVYRKKQ